MLSHPLLPKPKELRLSEMVDTLEERAELAREQKLSPVELLALLVDDEIERRRQKKQLRMERMAGFESLKLLSGFDFAAAPTLDRALVLDMATCSFIPRHGDWPMCGPTGVGKSHLATAIGYEAIKRDLKVLSFSVHKLLGELLPPEFAEDSLYLIGGPDMLPVQLRAGKERSKCPAYSSHRPISIFCASRRDLPREACRPASRAYACR